MSNYQKYLKYKEKYLNLKNQLGGNYDEEEIDMYQSSLNKEVCYYFLKEYKRLNIDIVVNIIDDGLTLNVKGEDLNDINIETFQSFNGYLYVNYKGKRVQFYLLRMKLKHLKQPFPEFYNKMLQNLKNTFEIRKQMELDAIENKKKFEIYLEKQFDEIKKGNLKKIDEGLYKNLLERGKIIANDWEEKSEMVYYFGGEHSTKVYYKRTV